MGGPPKADKGCDASSGIFRGAGISPLMAGESQKLPDNSHQEPISRNFQPVCDFPLYPSRGERMERHGMGHLALTLSQSFCTGDIKVPNGK